MTLNDLSQGAAQSVHTTGGKAVIGVQGTTTAFAAWTWLGAHSAEIASVGVIISSLCSVGMLIVTIRKNQK